VAAVLIAAAPQDQQAPPPAPVQTPPADPAAAPAAAPPRAAAPPDSGPAAPEFADPLTDPATLTVTPPAVTARHYHGDPLEGLNRSMFGLHQALDKAVYRPAAMGYKHVVPRPARTGLRHFFSNLTEPVVFVNYLLQLKLGKAAETFARFTINSVFGVAGLVDFARQPGINLPHRDNNFGNTLAYYGVGPGPYLFLPLVGPTTLRDILGGPVDGAVLPVAVGKPFNGWEYQIGSGVIPGLDLRAESDVELRTLFAGAVDPYATLRSVWMQNRAAEIAGLHHRKAASAVPAELDDPLADPATGGTAPSPPPSDARELQDPMTDPAAAAPSPVQAPN